MVKSINYLASGLALAAVAFGSEEVRQTESNPTLERIQKGQEGEECEDCEMYENMISEFSEQFNQMMGGITEKFQPLTDLATDLELEPTEEEIKELEECLNEESDDIAIEKCYDDFENNQLDKLAGPDTIDTIFNTIFNVASSFIDETDENEEEISEAKKMFEELKESTKEIVNMTPEQRKEKRQQIEGEMKEAAEKQLAEFNEEYAEELRKMVLNNPELLEEMQDLLEEEFTEEQIENASVEEILAVAKELEEIQEQKLEKQFQEFLNSQVLTSED